MAKIAKNSPMAAVSGKLGTLIFKQVKGQTIITRAPEKPRKESEKQREQRESFRKAITYSRRARSNPETNALYTAIAAASPRSLTAHNVAVTDYLARPVITAVNAEGYTGKAGETLVITTTHPVKVVSLKVQLLTYVGVVVEEGITTEHTSHRDEECLTTEWHYTTTKVNPHREGTRLSLVATDIPKHEVKKTFKI